MPSENTPQPEPAAPLGSYYGTCNGKTGYAWNKAIRLDVKFEAPLSRSW